MEGKTLGARMGSVGLGAACAVEAKEPQVNRAINILKKEMETMGVLTADLTARLNPVLISVPPRETGEGGKEETLCPLAGIMDSITYNVRSRNRDIRELLENLEL